VAVLVEPSESYADEFLAAEREFAESGGERLYDRYHGMLDDFAAYVHELLANQGQQLEETGSVPASWYWLVDAQTYIGRVSLRHRLNSRLRRLGGHIGYEIRPSQRGRGYGKQILALALLQARRVGLRRVLLVVAQSNTASQRIIEANGGVLEGVFRVHERSEPVRRYWIARSSQMGCH
jgi:predicted acetyltransferase